MDDQSSKKEVIIIEGQAFEGQVLPSSSGQQMLRTMGELGPIESLALFNHKNLSFTQLVTQEFFL